MTETSSHPVAVIGGGPVGLAAAAHLIRRGLPVRVYERGATVATNVRDWGHVRLFSPWNYNTDEAACALLKSHGWQEPPGDAMPTGSELFDNYLKPLAETPEMAAVIETGATVKAITRLGADKVLSQQRGEKPFVLTVSNGGGVIRRDLARAVIDASGTWTVPNPLGAGGIPAEGETENAGKIAYGIPDILGRDRDHFSRKAVLVVGAGHSAANVLLDLAKLAEHEPGTSITWATRGLNLARVFGGGQADKLLARGELGSNLKALVESGRLRLVSGFGITRVKRVGAGVVVIGDTSDGEREVGPFDRIVVATGQRPDLDITRELRLDLDPWLESAKALGPLIDPNLHSCGSVPPHGHRELAHPEPGFYTVGIKSYGRAPTFLMLTGYEQVRSVVAAIAGETSEADNVHLILPETGVCSTDRAGIPNAECCGGPAPAEADACCAADALAKSEGKAGCGCAVSRHEPVAKAGCCA